MSREMTVKHAEKLRNVPKAGSTKDGPATVRMEDVSGENMKNNKLPIIDFSAKSYLTFMKDPAQSKAPGIP